LVNMTRGPRAGPVEPLRSSDQDEGVRAFQEKRKPQWQGR
jgi:enoyl-CoA hydratase/carnithine racemase